MFVDSLADQQIPAEAVADRGARSDAVRILTAHRAKGLEWDEVWIVGAEEGVWPDLRARGSTLRAEELTREGIGSGPRPADLLEEERRLFYVACTRARRQLHVTAIDDPGDGGDRRSRFVDDVLAVLGQPEAVARSGRPRHHVSLDGLVAELRRAAADPTTSEALRQAAVERLAVLASQRAADGRPLVPLADPSRWWGLAAPTVNDRSVRDPDRPVSLSGSGLDGILGCPLKWFLEHEVHAETPRGTATSFGSVVHAIADFVAKGEVPEVLDDMDAEVDRVWPELRFEAGWQSESERREARAALGRFLGYHLRRDRELVDTEMRVSAEVVVPTPDGGEEAVRLSGFIDRVERDAQGRLVPIDLKNMRNPVPTKDVAQHGQLGVYQLLLREGGAAGSDTDDAPAPPVEVGGAALVQLRVDESKGSTDAKVQFQEALGDEEPTWVESRLGEAAQLLRSEEFAATVGPSCSYCAYKSTCPAKVQGEQVLT
jgi:RecB family exonuclease